VAGHGSGPLAFKIGVLLKVLANLVDAVKRTKFLKRRIGLRRWGLPSLPLLGVPLPQGRCRVGFRVLGAWAGSLAVTLIAVAVEASEATARKGAGSNGFGPRVQWGRRSEAMAASAGEWFLKHKEPGMKESAA